MTLYFRCPFRKEDNEYIYASADTFRGYIDLQCKIMDEIGPYFNNIILRLFDDILYNLDDEEQYICDKTEEEIRDELNLEISNLQDCPFIILCNDYFAKKYYKRIRSLIMI